MTMTTLVTRAEAEAWLRTFAGRLTGVPVRTLVTQGPAAMAILETAKEQNADLIVMTSHGRSGASRWVFGSVAEHVVRQSPCPLVVERTAGYSERASAITRPEVDARGPLPAPATR
jgi:nucleotide-binding universal stress UspA family protein